MIGRYGTRRFPAFRNPTIDTLDIGIRRHHVPFLLEVDITEARVLLQTLHVNSFNDSVFYSASRPSPPAPLPLRPAR